MSQDIIDTLFKLGYIVKEYDPKSMMTWVSIKTGGMYHANDPERIEAEKEALAKLVDVIREAIERSQEGDR